MKAAVFTSHGSSDVLDVIEVETPSPGPTDVLIEVKAFALNRLDLWTREGLPTLDIDFPHVGGSDFAGVISECGAQVQHLTEGMRVAVNPSISCNHCLHCRSGEISLCSELKLLGEHLWGGAAEYAVVPASNVLELPEAISFENAAAVSLTAMTAYRMITTKAGMKPGERVLITGSGGGVGTIATQIAHVLGGEVLALTSTAEKMETAKSLGAKTVLNYLETPEWSKKIWELTDREGVDIVIDSAGEAVFKQAVRSLSKGGRYVTCGATTGRRGEVNIALLFWKQLSILGSTMASHREFEEVMDLFFTGKIAPVIDSIFNIDQIEEAHHRLEDSDHIGKIVVRI